MQKLFELIGYTGTIKRITSSPTIFQSDAYYIHFTDGTELLVGQEFIQQPINCFQIGDTITIEKIRDMYKGKDGRYIHSFYSFILK